MPLKTEQLFRAEHDLPPDSLAHRRNWPEWAKRCIGSLAGLAALESLAQSKRPFHYLGSPFLHDVETMVPRVSKYTGQLGEYVTEEGPPKITVTSAPKLASMRAIINRLGMSSYVAGVDERCWSGWYTYRGSRQTISTADMITQAQRDPFLRFVAAIDISRIDDADIHNNMHDPTFMVDLRGESASAVRPDLIVPVVGWRDLPADMVVIDDPRVTRAEAERVFDWLWHTNGDQPIPSQVGLQTGDRQHAFQLRALGQLAAPMVVVG